MNSQIQLPPRILADDGESTLLTDALEVLIETDWSDWQSSNEVKRFALTGEVLPEYIAFLEQWFSDNYSLKIRRAGTRREANEKTVFVYFTPRTDIPCFKLTGWGVFEFIDFLKVSGFDFERVMKVVLTLDIEFANGSPFIWRPILSYLARKIEHEVELPEPLSLFDVLSGLIAEELGDDGHLLDAFLDRLIASRQKRPESQHFGELPFDIKSILKNQKALAPFLARRMAERLRLGDPTVIDTWLLLATNEWLDGFLCGDDEIRDVVEADYNSNPRNVAAHWTLLLMCDSGWHPQRVGEAQALCGNMAKARWSKLNADSTVINTSNFEQADLSQSKMNHCHFNGVNFSLADLSTTTITECGMRRSSFHFANLSRANIDNCQFNAAQMQGVILSEALIKKSLFVGCDLSDADMTSVVATNCNFWDAKFGQAEFANALLERCRLDRLDLRTALFYDAQLHHCSLTESNFEDSGLEGEFCDCNFSNSLMTGSVASGVVLRDCDFSKAGLADIEWNQCDLRGAKFVETAFHLGSTRCGTLDSPYPSHGTRTGYYTDDYEDLHFKNPESIRKAALVDCDLRGAVLDQTDFYLVDLRGSQFDPCYEPHLRRCGAILDD